MMRQGAVSGTQAIIKSPLLGKVQAQTAQPASQPKCQTIRNGLRKSCTDAVSIIEIVEVEIVDYAEVAAAVVVIVKVVVIRVIKFMTIKHCELR